jgi:twinkle protein
MTLHSHYNNTGILIEAGLPCVCGKGSDNTSLYEKEKDGSKWLHCHNCGKNSQYLLDSSNNSNNNQYNNNNTGNSKNMIECTNYKAIPNRKISQTTAEKFKVASGYYQNHPCIIFPYFDEHNKLAAQKLKFLDKNAPRIVATGKLQKYIMLGDTKHITHSLFGSHLWKHGGVKIVITEGEYDCMTIAQLQKYQHPVVSIPSGVNSAEKAIAANLNWLQDCFKEVILMFDMDKPGQDIIPHIVPMFHPGKCKIAKLPCKDANELLQQEPDIFKVSKIINSSILNASVYRPKGLVTIADIIDTIDDKPEMGLEYPWKPLTEWTNGITRPSVNIWAAGTSQGKTTFLKHIGVHLIKTYKEKIGIIFLEEQPKKTVISLAGIFAGQRFDNPKKSFVVEDRQVSLEELQNFVVLNKISSVSNTWDNIRDKIRHLAMAEKCKYIFLDHITKFSDNAGEQTANRLMEELMSQSSDMAMELDISLNFVSHLRKDSEGNKSPELGGDFTLNDLKGSTAIKQYAWNVFGIIRNKEDEIAANRNINKIVLKKCRDAGENEGKFCYVRYTPEDGMLNEISKKDIETNKAIEECSSKECNNFV